MHQWEPVKNNNDWYFKLLSSCIQFLTLMFHMLGVVAQDVATPDYKKLGAGASEVSPGVFYGSSVGKPAKRPPQLIRLLHEIQQDLALQENLTYRYSGMLMVWSDDCAHHRNIPTMVTCSMGSELSWTG